MKSRELLSIVLSLIMVFGVSAGAAYAQTDDVSISDSVEVTVSTAEDSGDVNDKVEVDDSAEVEHDDETKEDSDDDRDKDSDNSKDGKHDLDDRLESFCDMTDEEKRQFFADHPRLAQFSDRLANYCNLSDDKRETAIDDFINEHVPEARDLDDSMKEKMMDKDNHMDYDRLCALAESERASEIDDSAKLERISNWCNMNTEEREDYKKEHPDSMKDKIHDKMKLSDMSKRLKNMIMEKHDISDERMDEIKMKFKEKHGDGEKIKSEIKIKFKNHMAEMKIKMSEERKSAILDRVTEMRDFKMEMRQNASDLTDEDKQELRAEFIEKAKEIQLAWISPRAQMTAGIDAAEIECREGFSLVMKESNGVPLCLKADTALKMIDRGIVIPAI